MQCPSKLNKLHKVRGVRRKGQGDKAEEGNDEIFPTVFQEVDGG